MTRPAVVCDLDGVVWLADQVIPGAPEAIAALRASGHRVLFVTNNSFGRRSAVEAKLAGMGIPAAGDVVTSAMAAARLVERGQRVLLLGGPGAQEELEAAGAVVTTEGEGPVDAVVVGFHRTFDWDAMRRGSSAVRHGAKLIGTNDDATYPTPDGEVPGAGSIVAGVATAAGVAPLVAGKPYPPMAAIVRSIVGDTDIVMVGDRPDTDGRFAVALGGRFALVLSGVTKPSDLPVEPVPQLIADDLAAVAAILLA